MNLPIGILIYKAQRISDENAVIVGMWYFQEMFLPSSVKEKLQSVQDLQQKRCIVLTLTGTFDQICELITLSDKFSRVGSSRINGDNVVEHLTEAKDQPLMFDEITNAKGTSLALDTMVEIDESLDYLKTQVHFWKPIDVNISKGWSFFNCLNKLDS